MSCLAVLGNSIHWLCPKVTHDVLNHPSDINMNRSETFWDKISAKYDNQLKRYERTYLKTIENTKKYLDKTVFEKTTSSLYSLISVPSFILNYGDLLSSTSPPLISFLTAAQKPTHY